MKKTIIIIALVVAIGFVFWWLLSSPKRCDTSAVDHNQVVATHDTIEAHGVDYRRVIDSLSIDNYRLDSSNRSLVKGQAVYRKQLDQNAVQIKEQAARIKAANKDTALNAKIDSLVALVDNLTFILSQYEANADSINNVNDSLKINYGVTMKEKDKRIAEVQAAYDNLFKAYQNLFADSRVMAKDLKKQKLKTKIAVVLAGGAAVLGLLK